jgi:hypothetical protein
MVGHIDQYDGSSNPEEFIEVYQTIIEAAGGDDWVRAKFLHTALTRATRSCLINLPEGSIHSWASCVPCSLGTFRAHMSIQLLLRPSKPSSRSMMSLRDYIKHFCNARNVIPYIQDIEIINAFRNGISDIKTMEEIAMKKPKTVADLLAVADVCIEASKS